MPGPTLHVGTSGWSYSHWARGRFYPRGLKSNQWLRFFAQHFDTVEINASFYRLPKPEMIDRWRTQTGRAFRFAVKLWQQITHRKRLLDCRQELETFIGVVNALTPKRGPLLVQLPPSMQCDVPRLKAFLRDAKKAFGRRRWRVAVEFRHTSWLCPEVLDVLDEHGWALCLADLPKCPITQPGQAPFVYVRRHGPGGGYRGCYSPRQIGADARRIAGWLAEGKDVYLYYNNDIDGHAIDNARDLLTRVARSRCS